MYKFLSELFGVTVKVCEAIVATVQCGSPYNWYWGFLHNCGCSLLSCSYLGSSSKWSDLAGLLVWSMNIEFWESDSPCLLAAYSTSNAEIIQYSRH